MEYAMEMIGQEYLRYKKMLGAMEAEASQLPEGSLTYRTIKGKRYCYIQFCEDCERHNQVVPKENVEELEKVFSRKKFLEVNIKVCRKHVALLEKAYPHFKMLQSASGINNARAEEEKPYLTAKGDYVRSKSEVVIANELYYHQICYEYEKQLPLDEGRYILLPDFTICTPNKKKIVYWEHCGLMNDPAYRNNWERKKQKYARAGISDWQKNLIVTYESEYGGFSVEDVQQHIQWLLRE